MITFSISNYNDKEKKKLKLMFDSLNSQIKIDCNFDCDNCGIKKLCKNYIQWKKELELELE